MTILELVEIKQPYKKYKYSLFTKELAICILHLYSTAEAKQIGKKWHNTYS